MYNAVYGKSVMSIGDIHFSDVFKGKHISYIENCSWVLKQITNKLKEERPAALTLAGDLIGWTETNIKDREMLSLFIRVLKEWNQICPVYCLRGNHDIKGYPDFNLFAELGLIITSTACGGYFDYYANETDEIPQARYHMLDYKSEGRKLDLHSNPEVSNIALVHNNFTVSGATNWYQEHDGIELAMQTNLYGVDLVIAGHIHNPSPNIISTTLGDKQCMLFYPGCPTRPIKDKNIWESCWYLHVKYDEAAKACDIIPEEFKLRPSSEIFYSDEDFIDDEEKTEDDIQEELRKENLKTILGDLMKYRMQGGNLYNQIDIIPNASQEAKDKAKEYLQKAFA